MPFEDSAWEAAINALPRAAWYELPGVVGVSGCGDDGRGGTGGVGECTGDRTTFAPNDIDRRRVDMEPDCGLSMAKSKEDRPSDLIDFDVFATGELCALTVADQSRSSRSCPTSGVSG